MGIGERQDTGRVRATRAQVAAAMRARPLDAIAPAVDDGLFSDGSLPGAAAYCGALLAGVCSQRLSL